MTKYKIAGVVFDAEFISPQLIQLCQDYRYTGDLSAEFTLTITKQEMLAEHRKNPELSFWTTESFMAYSKLNEYLIKTRKGLMFHSTAIAVDGKAYLFTANSGVGKSTHARLWREVLGDKAVMINDDKPIITVENGVVYANGSPWQGKHNLGNDVKVPVKAVCKIERGKENGIERASFSEMVITVLEQTIRPETEDGINSLFSLIEEVLSKVDLCKLKCTPTKEAVKVSYEYMCGEKL